MLEDAPHTRERPPRTRHRRPPPPPLNERCALFLDIDGTLLEFAPTPDRVFVDPDLAALLNAFHRALGGAVALITGRTLASVERLFGRTTLPVAGLHGSERRSADGSLHRHEQAAAELAQLREDMARFAARHKGLLFEDKGAAFAIHYRRAPALASIVHRTLRRHATHASIVGWRLQRGKGILELRPEGRDKGTAIVDYLGEQPFKGRMPVFLGDDVTDEFGFAAVMALGGQAVKVGPGPTGAAFRLPDVSAVRQWLAESLAQIEARRAAAQ
ncbi:MAG TPA: trehalose-phosphatase [Casimicrobiaceae bacterium]|jgi:trehalose 6-phosphate phosphatase